jgi:hypothetical protein
MAAAAADSIASVPPLTAEVDDEFAERGFVRVQGVLGQDVMARASAALDDLYSSPEANVGHPGGRTDGVTQYCSHPSLFELYSHPALERVARFILRTDSVILQSSAILYTRPPVEADADGADAPLFTEEAEHVDVQYSLAEIDGTPRLQTCMLMVLIDDLPLGRANTYLRPGSHRLIAQHLDDNNLEPFKAHPLFKIRDDGECLYRAAASTLSVTLQPYFHGLATTDES